MCVPTTIKTLVDCPGNYANRNIVFKDYNAENAILKSFNVNILSQNYSITWTINISKHHFNYI